MEPNVTLLTMPSAAGLHLTQTGREALEQALAARSKLPPEVLAIPGMSGRKYRAFINNLIERLPAPHYLEIGSWAGSTLCSAIFGNDVDAVAIDNWSEFQGPSDQFFRNLAEFKGSARVSFLERDFRKVDYAKLGGIFGQFGIYLFDGPHSFEDQYDGIAIAQPAVAARYVQIVDDWNWIQVREGTMKAIADLGLHIEFMAEVRTSTDNNHPVDLSHERSDWHNGYFIGVLSRSV
jgi:hypothetical protein